MSTTPERFIGLISGTSVDGIDAGLVEFHNGQAQLLANHSHPIDSITRDELFALFQPGDNEIERMGSLDRRFGQLLADAVMALLDKTPFKANDITAIGSHGQTIRHNPPARETESFSIQIGDPNVIAEKTGITTVADFRRRDMVCGGHGAPLACSFHAAYFNSKTATRFIVNIGGISNITYLPSAGVLCGFDTGPGNALMDGWIHKHLGKDCDRGGAWAASGQCHENLLQQYLRHPFFALKPPKSTGREEFHLPWLAEQLEEIGESVSKEDVQATLLELTAKSIAQSILSLSDTEIEVYICGGGAHNTALLERLGEWLPKAMISTTEKLGVPPDWVEAATFAWLARQTLAGKPGNLPAVTGAEKPVVLGGIYPGMLV